MEILFSVESGLHDGTSQCPDQTNSEQKKELLPVDSDEDTSVAEETPEPHIELSDLMKMIAEQKKIPGVKELNIKPTNTEPTVSNVERVLKPWEVAKSVEKPK